MTYYQKNEKIMNKKEAAHKKVWSIDMELKWCNVVEKLSIIHWDDSFLVLKWVKLKKKLFSIHKSSYRLLCPPSVGKIGGS
jgi:hypothetical protein